ncbi:MAG: serine hydrolase [Ilumatobacteraceae bacterium]
MPLASNTVFPSAEWVVGKPDADVDANRLQSEIDGVIGDRENTGTTLAVLAIHRGRLVAEAYSEGTDSNTPLISWSMAKSFTHALVGIAVGDDLLNPDSTAPIEQWRNDGRREITLQHLLNMRSGLSWVEDYVDDKVSNVIEMLFGSGKDDHAAYAIAQPLADAVGSKWLYSSGTTNIICRIIGDVLGDGPGSRDQIFAFINVRLFDALGMKSATARFDLAGTFVGSSYVFASAADFARFGYLYLNDGVWNGRRILPEGWVDHARALTAVDPESGLGYGAQWWTLPNETMSLAACGYEGQYIIVAPTRDLVLVRLGKTPAEKRNAVLGSLISMIESFPVTNTV